MRMFKVKLKVLMQFVFVLKLIDCVEHTCVFQNESWLDNLIGGKNTYYYQCKINSAQLMNEDAKVIINTSSNQKLNSEVTSVYYVDGTIKFIPNIIFTSFINCDCLFMSTNNLNVIKPHNFNNAIKLRVLKIHYNDISTLEANLFEQAANLQHITFYDCKISSIHRLTFSGLQNLKAVDLRKNKITNLHPDAFVNLVSLEIVSMLEGENCLKKRFNSPRSQLSEIQEDIRKSCDYEVSKTDFVNLLNDSEDLRIMIKELQKTITSLESKVTATKKEIIEIIEENQKECKQQIQKAGHSTMETLAEILVIIQDQALMDEKIISLTQEVMDKFNSDEL